MPAAEGAIGDLEDSGMDVAATVSAINGFQVLVPSFDEMTLDPGAKPEEQYVQLHPPKGQALMAEAGDAATVDLLLTRGRTRKLKMPIEPEKEGS